MASDQVSNPSISQWLANLKYGDQAAAQKLWSRYAIRLIELARQRLGKIQKGVADEEDVAQLVFASLWRGATEGRFQDLKNRDELWWMLLTLTKHKATDHIRRETAQKRGGGNVISEAQLRRDSLEGDFAWTFDELIDKEPTPEFIVTLSEQHAYLMSRLRDDVLRQIASLRIEGYTVSEIAMKLAIAKRSVERKLSLIRTEWSQAFLEE